MACEDALCYDIERYVGGDYSVTTRKSIDMIGSFIRVVAAYERHI